MPLTITVNDKPLRLDITRAAQAALQRRTTPLILELELYFSCLVRKRACVREVSNTADTVSVADNLELSFRPVVTQQCAIADIDISNPPVKDMPMANPLRFFPYWVSLDYRKGEWQADFGYTSQNQARC